MSLPEVVHRGKSLLGNAAPLLLPTRGDPRGSLPIAARERRGRFFLSHRELEALRPELIRLVPRLEEEAGRLLDHTFTFLGQEGLRTGRHIRWTYNYAEGRGSPRMPALFLDHRDTGRFGDVKLIWEINRHQHLVPLSLLFFLTGDPVYAREVESQLAGWIQQNPFPMGINWTSPLEAALRLISWAWCFALHEAGGREVPEAFLQAVGVHCRFLHGNFSLHSSTGNHLIGEAAGLFVAALLYLEEPVRSRYLRDAYGQLVHALETLVAEDGTSRELSTGYHAFSLEFFLLADLLARRNGIAFPPVFGRRVQRMALFLDRIRTAQGACPALGDSDDACCLSFHHPLRPDHDALLHVAAFLYGGPVPPRAEDAPLPAKALLLTGDPGGAPVVASPARTGPGKEAPALWSFPDAGYHVLRGHLPSGSGIHLVFDCGPTGLPPMAGHGHADVLSFVLYVGGEPVFIDPGTYTYRTGDPWRSYFRGTAAHNTVRIDEIDQSAPAGPFLWSRTARGSMEDCAADGKGFRIRGQHDGYGRLDDPVIHTRELRAAFPARRITIEDRIGALREHRVEVFFHLAPACGLEQDGHRFRIRTPGPALELRLDSLLDPQAIKGRRTPPLGWASPAYGRKEPAWCILGTALLEGPGTFRTEIRIDP